MLVGIDSIDSIRMEKHLEDKLFLNKYFTEYEIEYANLTINKTLRLAGIFCAKEAFLKALGIGIGGGIDLKDIEVRHMESGKPFLNLSESANKYLENHQLKEIQMNISHTNSFSFAVCVLL